MAPINCLSIASLNDTRCIIYSTIVLAIGPAQVAAGGQRAIGQEGGPPEGVGALRLQGHP